MDTNFANFFIEFLSRSYEITSVFQEDVPEITPREISEITKGYNKLISDITELENCLNDICGENLAKTREPKASQTFQPPWKAGARQEIPQSSNQMQQTLLKAELRKVLFFLPHGRRFLLYKI